jgi:hypothetical protein
MKFEEYCRSHPKFTVSQNAYRYCKYVKDSKKVRFKITNEFDIVKYCLNVKDRRSFRSKINQSVIAYLYCRHIESREEIKAKIACKIQLTKLNLYLNGENENKYKYAPIATQLAA